jgi:ubiquinone/menaquinone biosynthesis C-methylase UbiE
MEIGSFLPMVDVASVQRFWDANPCGSQLSNQTDRRSYFDEIAVRRYAHEPHIPAVARFSEFRDRRVLEIGTGLGTDGLQFQKNAARYVGIDLTLAGQKLTSEQFRLAGYDGSLAVGNAELLPAAHNSFDHIYSFGVIHHSPSTEAIADEMFRVLKPGGTFCVMVYNRSSINYYVEIIFLRKVFRQMLILPFTIGLLSKLPGLERNKLERHRDLLSSRPKMTKEEWISINTDGPDCPLAKVYDRQEVTNLFAKFSDVKTEVWFFDRTHWSFLGKLIPDSVANFLGRRWGWHRIVYGRKPNS